jgi:hypothetical protein
VREASESGQRLASSARIAWFATSASQTDRDRPAPPTSLPPPQNVRAVRGRGQVTIDWSPVAGAAGYLVHRGATVDGPFEPIDQHSGDVLAVPHGPYLDTTSPPVAEPWYAVSSVPTIETEGGSLSTPVVVGAGPADATVSIRVDAGRVLGRIARPWRPIIGSEHLALLLCGSGPGGRDVGAELAEAFRIVRRELGVDAVRAHAILDDTLAVYRDEGGSPVHNFSKVDEVFDLLLATGLRPIVELSYMPRYLATAPDATVFAYRGIISPPRDHERWAAHAHIRYIEAMARIGRPDEAFRGLLAVCPIRLDLDVPSALPRQSSTFFSSSDAAFMDRGQASRQFGRIKTGGVEVKGGWRVYSSGPGIYINQLISNVIGVRTYFDDVVLDPVLPRDADGLTFDFEYDGRPVRYLYHVAGDGFSPREVRINGRRMPAGRYADNPYRSGGMLISRRAFREALDRDENLVEIFV